MWRGVALVAAVIAAFVGIQEVGRSDKTWASELRHGSAERRRACVWTVALSADVPTEVERLGGDAVPALIESLESDDQMLVEGAIWVLCQLSDKKAMAACSSYDTPPVLVSQPKPFYPADAFRKKVEGTSTVRMLIGSDGLVVHAAIAESKKPLDLAALQCVRRWRFEPAKRNGHPVPSVALAPVSFRFE